MGRKIWLVNQYAMPPELESRLRTIKFAQYLMEAGYDVTIFGSSIMHNMNKNLIEDNKLYIEKKYGNINFIHINTTLYKKNGLNRILGLFQFPFRFIKIAKKFDKPDVIIQTATVPFGNILYFYTKKNKIKYIVEVLDLWPQTFVDLKMFSKWNPIVLISYYLEKWLYKRADCLVFSMEGGKQYIKDKKWSIELGGKIDLSKVHYINNGVDLDDFNRYKNEFVIKDDELEDDSITKVVYLGSIRLANNLKRLIDAAALLKGYDNVKFLIYGDGDDRDFLIEYCVENDITNVSFKEKWIKPQYVPYVLTKASINVLNYMPGDFGKYGGSQSKLFQYLAAGKPICSNINMSFDIINKYNVGISKEFKSDKEYADAILSLIKMDKVEYNYMCDRALIAANDFDYKCLTNKMKTLI
ncbi:glycosyltransferase family 4 protein [uncultured Acetobacteroides sp.]|uniref:glycosyltransferase family 4 protein n=1 Tax=uncultured Acetobacteroides sp. TaxID=1760811 RepID=UPI0029F4FACA|nr:glycosyltransferase family 4 protein [uncultured Acetobacteroides sp.]